MRHGAHALLQPSGSTVVSKAVSRDVASRWRCWSLSLCFPGPKEPGLATCPQLDSQSKKLTKKVGKGVCSLWSHGEEP